MGTHQNQQYQYNHGLSRTMKMPAIGRPVAHEERENQDMKEVLPGVLVVRSNTPRPHSFEPMIPPEGQSQSGQQSEAASLPAFPSRAPSAPPLPEELSEEEDEELPPTVVPITSTSGALKQVAEDPQEFLWLFEYGLEMDAAVLNSAERLDGFALLYGPAVLKGYAIMFGSARAYDGRSSADQTFVTIVPHSEPDAEVWGVLYRIPRRIAESNEHEPSLLDTVHGAGNHDSLFKCVQVVVHETYRNREIACVTYLVPDAVRQRLRLFSWQQGGDQTVLAQRLATIARKQKLPEKYLSIYPATTPFPFHAATANAEPARFPARGLQSVDVLSLRNMPDTEPLPVVKEKSSTQPPANTKAEVPETPIAPQTNRWLIVFALYLATVLLAVLAVAMLQGFGNGDLTTGFRPLGVPVLVLVYGLLGGCVSSIITLGRYRVANPPLYVVITWFTRPYIGAVLATLTYLLFTSGFFIITDDSMRHHALFLFIGALAGLCEGWLFFRSFNPSNGSS